MRIQPEHSSVSIVLVGSLNAAIFHPAWFVANELLCKDNLEGAEVELVHHQLTAFKMGDWLNIRVEPSRFIAETSEPPFVRLSDLVVRTFGEVLTHTPISMMGINRRVHFSVGDETTRNRIGQVLAPQEAWGEWASAIASKKSEKHGGMISLTMSQEDLEDRELGHIRAKVEPSVLIKGNSGVFVEINDHYEISDKASPDGAIRITALLARQFDDSIRRSEWIIDQVMALKEKV